MELPPSRTTTALVEILWCGPVLTIKLAGPVIDHNAAAILRVDISPYLTLETITVLVTDFSNVTFIGEAGLGLLFIIRQAAAQVGATLVLYNLNADLQSMLINLGLNVAFRIVDSPLELAELMET